MNMFIFTTDKETAQKLKEQGFVLYRKLRDQWFFLNDTSRNFSNIDQSKIRETNIMFG